MQRRRNTETVFSSLLDIGQFLLLSSRAYSAIPIVHVYHGRLMQDRHRCLNCSFEDHLFFGEAWVDENIATQLRCHPSSIQTFIRMDFRTTVGINDQAMGDGEQANTGHHGHHPKNEIFPSRHAKKCHKKYPRPLRWDRRVDHRYNRKMIKCVRV